MTFFKNVYYKSSLRTESYSTICCVFISECPVIIPSITLSIIAMYLLPLKKQHFPLVLDYHNPLLHSLLFAGFMHL